MTGQAATNRAGVLAVVAIAFVLGACNFAKVASPTSTSAPASSSTTASSAPVSTSAPGAATCSVGVLQLSVAAGGAAAGSSFETFTLENAGPSTCSLEGYPTLTLYGASPAGGAGAGPRLALTSVEGGPTPQPVTLDKGQSAEFLVLFSDVPVGGAGCSDVASVGVAPTDSGEALNAPVSFSPCGPSVKVYPIAAAGSESP
jgi:Protein of unknown function (DUF4232)